MLREHRAVFSMNSSIRFSTGDLTRVVGGALASGGVLTFDNTFHYCFSTTNPNMYRYLPVEKAAVVNSTIRGACAVYIRKTKRLYDDLIRWLVLCALVKD